MGMPSRGTQKFSIEGHKGIQNVREREKERKKERRDVNERLSREEITEINKDMKIYKCVIVRKERDRSLAYKDIWE